MYVGLASASSAYVFVCCDVYSIGLHTFQSRIANKLLQFVHGIKVNCNAPIELKQTLDSLTPIVDRETPSKNTYTYELRGRVNLKLKSI